MSAPRPIRVLFAAAVIAALAAVPACDDSSTIVRSPHDDLTLTPVYTLDEVREVPITDLVGQKITVEARVYWENYVPGCIPEAECPQDEYHATVLTVYYENGDDYVPERFRGQERGNMRIESDAVTSEFNDSKVEEYYFDGELLDREVIYHLTGVFAYRDWVGGGDPPVDNPDFIEQTNQVTYWSQLLEFQLEKIEVYE